MIFSFGEPRRAVVTGGASGFGYAVAKRLIETGAKVVLADINQEQLRKAVGNLGENASFVGMNVTNRSEVQEGIETAVERMGSLDTLVTSAGVFTFGEMTQISEQEWDLTIDVNLKGTFFAAQAALPHLRKTGRGRIVTISSTSGMRGDDMASHYLSLIHI